MGKLSKKYEILIGFPKDKQVVYPPDDRKGHSDKGGQTVASVASGNEFGIPSKKVPSRPFLSTTLARNREKIKDLIKRAFTSSQINNPIRFDIIGRAIVDMVKDNIVNGNWQENSEKTKLNKLKWATRKMVGSKDLKKQKIVAAELAQIRPLIDRGIMRKNVQYEVKEL